MDAVPTTRKFWVGPRNELRRTKVTTQMTISDAGLAHLAGIDEATVWSALGKSWEYHTSSPYRPEWLTESGREDLEWDSEADEDLEYYHTRNFVEALTRAGEEEDKELRHDLVREALAGYGGGVNLGALVEVVGPEFVELLIKVDSNAGAGESEFDFAFHHRGSEATVQSSVLGGVI